MVKAEEDGNPRADLAHGVTHGKEHNNAVGLCVTQLAELPAESLLDSAALARCLSVSTRTLRRMAGRGELPKGIKLGGRRVWIAGKILEFLAHRADRHAAEAKKVAARLAVVRG